MPAVTAPVSAKIDPTYKLIPPVKMTKVMPNAINALIDTCLGMFKILLMDRKLGLIAVMMMMIKIKKNRRDFFGTSLY